MTTMLWQDAARFLAEQPGIGLSRNELENLLETFGSNYAVDVWGVPDVIWQANSEGYPMSEQEARTILERMESKIDNEYGLTWVTLSTTIQLWWRDFDILTAAENPETAAALTGGFVVVAMPDPDTGQEEEVVWAKKGRLADAVEQAMQLAKAQKRDVRIWGVPPATIEEKDASFGMELLVAYFDPEIGEAALEVC